MSWRAPVSLKNKNQKREGRQEQKRLGCLQTLQGGEWSVVPKSEGHIGELGANLQRWRGWKVQGPDCRAKGVVYSKGSDEPLWVVLDHPLLCTQVSGSPSCRDRD